MKTTFEIIQAIICALLLINIGIMIAASLDRKSRRYAKEVIRETLRMKMLASRDLGKYALYVSPSCVKVALAGDHQLALLSGMNDFWDAVPTTPNRVQVELDTFDGGFIMAVIDCRNGLKSIQKRMPRGIT